MDKLRPGSKDTPALSVVVVAINGAALLRECLSALMSQAGEDEMEIQVVSKEAAADMSLDNTLSSRVCWRRAPATGTVPAMRSLGIEQANARLVALLEDDCIVGPAWLDSVLAAHRSGHAVAGGAIEPGDYSRGLDWAVFYCEYARFLLPFSGRVRALPGNNVSYEKAVLEHGSVRHGFYEIFIHEHWLESGQALYAVDGMVVTNRNTWCLKHCTSMPFHHGRAYAAQRFGSQFGTRRLLYGVLASVLPFVKTARTLREVFSRKRSELPILKALPWIILFQGCWAIGELAGYLAGPGRSIEKWG